MTDYEILKYIDSGAIFYLDFFGNAEHMEIKDNGIFRFVSPKNNGQGVRFAYDIRFYNLTIGEANIAMIKALKNACLVAVIYFKRSLSVNP